MQDATTMNVKVMTPQKTINLESVKDIVFPTPNGPKHIEKKNGQVDSLKKGKISLLIQRTDSDKPETIEMYVDSGVVYVEHSTINIVTEKASNNKPWLDEESI